MLLSGGSSSSPAVLVVAVMVVAVVVVVVAVSPPVGRVLHRGWLRPDVASIDLAAVLIHPHPPPVVRGLVAGDGGREALVLRQRARPHAPRPALPAPPRLLLTVYAQLATGPRPLRAPAPAAAAELLLDVGGGLLLALALVVHDAALHVRLLERGAALLHHAAPPLLLVEEGEVLGDDGDGERDHEGPRHRADGAHHAAHRGLGRHVPVTEIISSCDKNQDHALVPPDSSHGDGRPPEGVHHVGEGGVLLPLLRHVGQRAEDQDPDADEHQDEHQLLVGGAHGVAQTCGTLHVTRYKLFSAAVTALIFVTLILEVIIVTHTAKT